jgi:3',5'-cyclic AMP phosphodiesterase CpdA
VRLAWATDVHLNFLGAADRARFAAQVAATPTEGVLITCDIAEADSFERLLDEVAAAVAPRPVWFVLGNHDFYRGGIAEVRAQAAAMTTARWLPAAGVVQLTSDVALVGHDGWGDARLGDPAYTRVELSDFHLIRDLVGTSRRARHAILRRLGDEAAAALRDLVTRALDVARHIVVATHVPPFRESCWHEGQISNDEWLPYFTCAAVGDVLRELMTARPDARMTVYCGHTHSGGAAELLPNLNVVTGAAQYGAPTVQTIEV